MTIEEMKQIKKKKGYTYSMISELSGIPLGTVQKVFCGETESPRYDTLRALEKLFTGDAADYSAEDCMVGENSSAYEVHKQGSYTLEDYYALPDDQRFELIDGYLIKMDAPTTWHQLIGGEIYRQIANFIIENNGECRAFISPVDVQLDCDDRTMVEPDVVILCKGDKQKRRVIYGAPDFVLEVLSPSTRRKDCTKKLAKYENAGVREYWIVDPTQKRLLVYFFESEIYPVIYGFDEPVPINIYDGKLQIQFDSIRKWIEEDEETGEE